MVSCEAVDSTFNEKRDEVFSKSIFCSAEARNVVESLLPKTHYGKTFENCLFFHGITSSLNHIGFRPLRDMQPPEKAEA
jgi:hypothetical protein